MNKKEKLLKLKSEYSVLLEKQNQYTNKLSICRGVIFLTILVLIILYFVFHKSFLLFILFGFIFIFTTLVIIHKKVDNKNRYYSDYVKTINEYIDRYDGTFVGSKDNTGIEFFNEKEDFMLDLDIVGDNSLYQYISICRTHLGKKRLYESLNNSKIDDDNLYKRQESIKELGKELEFCLDFQCKGYRITNNTYFPKVNKEPLKNTILFLVIGLIVTLLFFVFFVLSALHIINALFLLIPCAMQIIVISIYSKINKKALDNIKYVNNSVFLIKNLTKGISYDFKSSLLCETISVIKKANEKSKMIEVITDLDTFRNMLITRLFLNLLFPFSILLLTIYNKAIKVCAKYIDDGINGYEILEGLVSLSIIYHTRECVCLPKRSDHTRISVSNLTHPVLSQKSFIANDFETGASINVITGSNMSGKTSFMRTVGINEVLMNAGGYVCADSFESSYFKIFTSMRTLDNISKGVSTFYAELLKIKKALEYLNTNENILTLIDEVFSGTNSNDRISGAKMLLNKLNKDNSVVIVTTHDFELCDISIDNLYNYHFSEYYENDVIRFDYKIKKGKCQTTNAIYLMKIIGINC